MLQGLRKQIVTTNRVHFIVILGILSLNSGIIAMEGFVNCTEGPLVLIGLGCHPCGTVRHLAMRGSLFYRFIMRIPQSLLQGRVGVVQGRVPSVRA